MTGMQVWDFNKSLKYVILGLIPCILEEQPEVKPTVARSPPLAGSPYGSQPTLNSPFVVRATSDPPSTVEHAY